MTAEMKINRRPAVDKAASATAAAPAVAAAMSAAIERAGLVDTGKLRDQIIASADGDEINVSATGDRAIAAAVHQARLGWATMTPADRKRVAAAVKAAPGTVKKVAAAPSLT